MLRAVLDFQGMSSREIMVPRTQMVAIEISTPIERVLDLIIESGHSRYPVYRDRADQVLGVLYAKDLFRAIKDRGSRDFKLGEVVRKDVFFVAETSRKRITLSHEHEGSAFLPLDAARKRLTYANARAILDAAATFLGAGKPEKTLFSDVSDKLSE